MEQVNHPDHYNIPGRKECLIELEEKYGPYLVVSFCLTNAYKYLYRAGHKEGNSEQQDIDKAKFYFNYISNKNSQVCLMGRKVAKLYNDIKRELEQYD